MNKKMTADERNSFGQRFIRDFFKNKDLYLLVLPVLVYYALFQYKPMYGVLIAFKDYKPALGVWGSRWVGFDNFIEFFTGPYFTRTLSNTITISLTTLIVGFPAPIIMALLINELRSKIFSRAVQTITYLPHFISTVVVVGMIVQFVKDTGFITVLLGPFGVPAKNMLNNPSYFVPIYVISGIWQEVGWGSIIYLAALQGIDQELYEAAKIDGANRWKQTLNVTIPGIIPQIIILLILRMGSLLNVGYEKILLMYNPLTFSAADVISTYTYRVGLQDFKFSYSTAVNLFNSLINVTLVFTANKISSKFSETSLF